MSNIYIQEPSTEGKVLLSTTLGEIEIELWSKEAPLACRNFVQLCLEGYYNGTGFHRVIPGFIAQGGDPLGTGEGGESIYGKTFKDEFHSRLRFVRRGLVAMANSGPNDNGSQFFFTLGPCKELHNKHTIFGKVAGDTLYNLPRFEEGEIGKDDRPVYPAKINKCEVLMNPFSDIVPREGITNEVAKQDRKKKKKGVKNFSLLSFGVEAEEEEAEVITATAAMSAAAKSITEAALVEGGGGGTIDDITSVPLPEKQGAKERIREKLRGLTAASDSKDKESVGDEENNKKEPDIPPTGGDATSNNEISPIKTDNKRTEKEGKRKSHKEKKDRKRDRSEEGDRTDSKHGRSEKKRRKSRDDNKHSDESDGDKKARDKPREEDKNRGTDHKRHGSASSSSKDTEKSSSNRGTDKSDSRSTEKSSSRNENKSSRSKSTEYKGSRRSTDNKSSGEKKTATDDNNDKANSSEKKTSGESNGIAKNSSSDKSANSKSNSEKRTATGDNYESSKSSKSRNGTVNSNKHSLKHDEVEDDLKSGTESNRQEDVAPSGRSTAESSASKGDADTEQDPEKAKKLAEMRSEIKQLKRELSGRDSKTQQGSDNSTKQQQQTDAPRKSVAVQQYRSEMVKYGDKKRDLQKGSKREDLTLALLDKFTNKVRTKLNSTAEEEEEAGEEKELDDDDDESWLTQKLIFEVDTPVVAKDASTKDDTWYPLDDPRHPLNKRRRGDDRPTTKR